MEKEMKKIVITTNDSSMIKERAALLADSINEVKQRGIVIESCEPIEGKVFWPETV